MELFYSLCNPGNASSNKDQKDTVFDPYDVHVIYLLKTERGDRKYGTHGNIIKYCQVRKISFKFQCGF